MNAQQLIIGHLLPVAGGIVLLWMAYRLLFINSNRLKFNRLFLLTAMLFSLALPLISPLIGMSSPQVAALKQNLFNSFLLNEITVTERPLALPEVVVETDSQPHFSLWQVLIGIYLIGVGVMTLLFLIKIGRLTIMIARSPKEKREGYTAIFTAREQGSFSFLRYAFFPNKEVSPDIVRHELSHISHHHSWDILFTEVMMVLQWFNPFIYRYKKELQSLHEYQADRDVVATGVDKKNYMMLILQQCTAADFSGMSNNFSLILTKKRIKMITKNEKAKGLWWRLLATLPVLIMLLIANTKVAAQEKKTVDTLKIQFTLFDDNGNPTTINDTVIYDSDGSGAYLQIKTSPATDPISGEPRKKITVTSHNADGTPTSDFNITAMENKGDIASYSIDPFSISSEKFKIILSSIEDMKVEHKNNDSIFQIVQQVPKFPGGENALMEYIGSNIKYPQEAQDKDIQGRVFVSFVVEKDGSIGEVKLQRGIGGGCDEEAMRVVKNMPKWEPGMQDGKPVRVSYQLPVLFKLKGDKPADKKQKTDKSTKAVDMKPNKNGVFTIVEEMPRFPGGENALMEHIISNIKYPQEAQDKNIQGRVFISFVVEKDGSIDEVKLLKGIGGGCDEEAMRVVKNMPKWEPGMQDGKPVRVSYQIPIMFKNKE